MTTDEIAELLETAVRERWPADRLRELAEALAPKQKEAKPKK